jgi:glucose/arabinose dehydrogenase
MNKNTKILLILLVLFIIGAVLVSKITHIPSTSLNSIEQPKITKNTTREMGGELPFPLHVPDEYTIGLFANNLGKARDLEFTKDGILLVSDPDSNSVFALKDADHDGIAESKKAVITGGNAVHGLAIHKDDLYVALKNSVRLYHWNASSQTADFVKELLTYPGDQNHIFRTLVFGSDNKLYISLGSNCNVCYEKDQEEGTVIVANADGSGQQIFAKGQRNAPFLTINPSTHQIWATGMGRDYLGDNLPPDEINILQNGKDYGWPICYGNKVHDTNFDKRQYSKDPCSETIAPVYEIAAHSAPLGLTFAPGSFISGSNLFVAYHGSWNRSTPIGYKVIRLELNGNTIDKEDDFVTGFIDNGTVNGRPVDLTFDSSGNLYISDDKTGNVYIVSKK